MDENKALEMYEKLMGFAEDLHLGNKKRILNGIIALFVLPAFLFVMMTMTNSSRILFLIIWIISMFAIATYLIGVAFIDSKLQKVINEILDMEQDYDNLMGYGPEMAQIRFKRRHKKFQQNIKNAKETFEEFEEKKERKKQEIQIELKNYHKDIIERLKNEDKEQ